MSTATRAADAAVRAPVVAFGEVLFDAFRDRVVMGGAPLNVACHLHAFGMRPLLISRVGMDADGDALRQTLAARGLRTDGVQRDAHHPTGRVRVVEDGDGHRFEVLSEQAYDHVDAAQACEVAAAAAPQLIYFGTLAQRGASSAALQCVLDLAGAVPFLDLNLRDPWVDEAVVRRSLERARIVKLNAEELARLAAMFSLRGHSSIDRLSSLIAGFDLECVVLTRGAEGALAVDHGGDVVDVEGTALRDLVDTVGAGDGFAAVVALGWLQGWPRSTRLARADAFARELCGVRGAIPPSFDFYRPFIDAWRLDAAPEEGAARA